MKDLHEMAQYSSSNICRVCLRQSKRIKNVFDVHKSAPIHQQISMIANVVIEKDDGLPHNICSSCIKSLDTAIEFKAKCESSNASLKAEYEDFKKVVVKKEEPDIDLETKSEEAYEETEFLEDLLEYLDPDVAHDDLKAEPEFVEANTTFNKVQMGLRPSRAIDLNLECHDCGGLFKSKCKLRVHWKKVHLPQSLVCDKCKRQFRSVKAFQLHQTTNQGSCKYLLYARIEVNGKKRIFYCKDCPYSTKKPLSFKSHLVTHTGVRPFVCDLCGSTHTQQSSLQAHKESKHKTYLSEATCSYCGKFIKGRNRMYRHMKIHKQKESECNICEKIFKSHASMLQHQARHTGVKSFACEICGGAFYTLSELSNHKRMVHRKDEIWFKCELCNYRAHRKEKITKHMKKHTSSNIPCTVCGMFFDSQQDLLSHQRKHFGVRNYACQYCEKRFLTRDGIFKHVRKIHFKNKVYTPHSFALPDSKRGRKKNSEKLQNSNPDVNNSVKAEEKVEVVEIQE